MSRETTVSAPEPAGVNFTELGRILLRVWPFIKPQWKHVAAFLGINAINGTVVTIATLLVIDVYNNTVLEGESLESNQTTILFLDSTYVESDSLTDEQRRVVLTRLMIFVAVVATFFLLLFDVLLVSLYEIWIAQRINQNLRVTMIERAEHLSLRYHSHARTGDIIYRVFQDSSMITDLISSWILDPMQQISSWGFAFFILFLFSPTLALLCFITCLPIAWLFVWYTPRIQRRAWIARQSNSDLTSHIQEVSAGIRVLKANQAEGIAIERFNRDSNRALDNAFKLRVEIICMQIAVALIAGTLFIVARYLMAGWSIDKEATWVGGWNINEEGTMLAGIVALVGIAVWNLGAYQAASSRADTFSGLLGFFTGKWATIQDMAIGLNRAFFLIDLKPDVVDAENPVDMPAPIREVAFRSVRFGYDPDNPVLKNVDLDAHAGTITAIVGATGSGKSTLMSMLLRLYDPDEGSVSINGVDLKEIRIEALRASVAIALQQNVLFATTVAENIGYATKNASREVIESAAKIACADTFIESMEHGYDTELGERGGKLSAGQRQRLTIARAIVRDTPLLILDEPTASLDAETEQQVLANLASWGQGRVLFLVTHRLSTIKNADQIAFLEDGRIVEVGDHDTLMGNPDGRYRNFVFAETEGADSGDVS